MKIFVAGGTGVLGRRVVPLLVKDGHEVSVIARSDAKAGEVGAAGAAPVRISLFDADAVRDAVAGHDVVINLATHIPPSTKMMSTKAWDENNRIRTEGARNLVDAALAANASRYIQEALAFVYRSADDRWLDESSPLADTPFTAAVRAAEAEAVRFTDSGGTGVILRFGQFYAPEAGHSMDQVRYARRGRAMTAGSPDAYWPLIAADDAASAVVAALRAPAGAYNIVDDEPLTRAASNDAFAAAVGRKRLKPLPRLIVRVMAKKAPNMTSSQRVSNAAFKAATGWQPAYPSFREGLPWLLGAANENAEAT